MHSSSRCLVFALVLYGGCAAAPLGVTPLDVDLGTLPCPGTTASCALSDLCPFDGAWVAPPNTEPPMGSWAGTRVLRGRTSILSTTPVVVLLNGSVAVLRPPTPLSTPGTTVQWLVRDTASAPSLPMRTTIFLAAFAYVGNGSRGDDPGLPPDKQSLMLDALAAPTLLMLSVGFHDNAGDPVPSLCDAACAQAAMFTRPDAVAALFADSSGGAVVFNRSGSAYAHVQTGHSTFTAVCNFGAWAADALAAFDATGGNSSRYLIKVFLLPPDAGSGTCGWLGLAYVGCTAAACSAWLRTPSPPAWVHELGHVYGLGHSSLDENNDGGADAGIAGAYGDWSDPMGNGDRAVRFSALHRYMLGWLPPAAVTFASTYTASTYTLTTASATAGAAGTQLLRVPSTVASEPPYWFSLRTLAGMDQALGANWAPAVYAHRADAASPATPTLLVWQSATATSDGIGGGGMHYTHSPSGMDVVVVVTPPAAATLWFRTCSRHGVGLAPVPGTALLRVTNMDEFCPAVAYLVFVAQLVPGAGPYCAVASVTLMPDNFPAEMSFELRTANGTLLLSGGVGTFSTQLCAPVTTPFTAVFIDRGRDGYCCFSGQGGYTLSLGDTVLATGGAFGYVESVAFLLTPQWHTGLVDAGASVVVDLGNDAASAAAVTARDGNGVDVTISVFFSASHTAAPSPSSTRGGASTSASASRTQTASRSRVSVTASSTGTGSRTRTPPHSHADPIKLSVPLHSKQVADPILVRLSFCRTVAKG